LALAILAAAVVLSLTRRLVSGAPLRWGPLLASLAAVGLVKGGVLSFLAVARPYRSGFLANGVSELVGLGFSLSAFGLPWGALAVGLVASTFVEAVALLLLTSLDAWHGLGIAFYMNLVAHSAVAAVILLDRSTLAAGLSAGLAWTLFLLPIFVRRRR
jgi:hypothetical protein